MGFLGFSWPAFECAVVQYPVQLGTGAENCDRRGVIFGDDYDKDDAPQSIQKPPGTDGFLFPVSCFLFPVSCFLFPVGASMLAINSRALRLTR